MSALRFLFVLLFVLNLLALAAIRGWLGTPDGTRGEPERLTNQLRPELIRLRPPSSAGTPPAAPAPTPTAPTPTAPPPALEAPPPAPAAPAEAPADTAAAPVQACLVLSGLTAAQADSLSSSVASPEITIARDTSSTPTAWWVRIPPAASREEAERTMSELRATGVTDLFLIQDNGPNRFAISLGLFKGEAAARQHLAELQAKGVRGAELATRNGSVHRLEIRGPAERLATLAGEITAAIPSAERSECQP